MSIDPDAIINIDALPWHDYEAIRIEGQRIRRDLATADELLKDAIARYKKKKFSASSKKQAEEIAAMFVDLEGYRNTDEIQDDYGYNNITERERDRLMGLWEAREQAQRNSGIFTDRVIDMLEIARRVIGDKYLDKLDLADTMEHIVTQQQQQLKSERWEG